MKQLVELRNKLKSKMPSFRRHDSHKKSRVSSAWRRPRGRQSKQRLHLRGYARGRSSGFGSPNAVRGLSHEGLTQSMVSTVSDFKGLDPKVNGIVVSRTLGDRKRKEIVDHATKNNFTLLNVDAKEFQKALDEKLKSKSAKKKEFEKKQKEKEQTAKDQEKKEKKAKEKAESPKEAPQSEEQAKEEEKKEYDKLLTKA